MPTMLFIGSARRYICGDKSVDSTVRGEVVVGRGSRSGRDRALTGATEDAERQGSIPDRIALGERNGLAANSKQQSKKECKEQKSKSWALGVGMVEIACRRHPEG